MPWFKVDDNLAFHAKTVAAGNPAMGLWVRAGSWCAQNLTDGFIPRHMLLAFGTTQQAKRLVDVGLWERVEGGYGFHEWTERQPRRDDVEAERLAARERMRDMRAKKKGVKKTPSPQVQPESSENVRANKPRSSGEVRDVFGNPDPVPVPVPTHLKTPALRGGSDTSFDEFWNAYGKKVGKGAAEKSWAKAIKQATPELIIAAAVEHRAFHMREKTAARFIPHPATWLNEKRWTDERTDTPFRRTSGEIDWEAAMQRAKERDERETA